MIRNNINVPYQIVAVFGDPVGSNGKDEVRCYCPNCLERKGSPDKSGHLFVNTKTLVYHCVRCDYSGVIRRDLKVDSRKIYDEEKEKDVSDTIRKFKEIFSGEDSYPFKIPIDKVTTSSTATKYLLQRGFTLEQMEYYDMRVGSLSQEFGRIIIPNRVSKRVYTDMYSARSYIDQSPKYHNPFDAKKSHIVFNLHRIPEGSPIILVEGVLTAVAAGFHAVSSFGKILSRSQASQIVAKHPSVIYVNYDYNTLRESNDACRLLRSLSPEVKILNVIMKDDRDAADMSREEYVKCLESAVLYEPPIYKDILELINDS